MNKLIASLATGDVAVVMGTSCDVVHFDLMLADRRCHKAINSLNRW